MNGSPPNRYGFHCGMLWWARKYSAPKLRNAYPARIWSLPSSTWPPSMGQQSASAASANTRTAARAGRGGSQISAGAGSEDDTRAPSGEQKERGGSPELGQGEQQPGCDRQRRRRTDADRLLQHYDEQPFAHP